MHCASGNRAAALWMIKRIVVDKWDADRAGTEAAALGLTNPALKTFALTFSTSGGPVADIRAAEAQDKDWPPPAR